MSTPDPDRLPDLLNAAGREVQPTAQGWESLPSRLTQKAPVRPRRLGPLAKVLIVVDAAVVAGLVALWLLLPQFHVQAQEQPIEVRRESVDLTVLSVAWTEEETLYMPILGWTRVDAAPRQKKLTGQALVKDRRLVLNLKAGDNIVRFTDVAATIDPTSVRFQSLTDPEGTTVVAQSFEYDLATADALLKRFIDREIVCIDKKGQEISGLLASFDDAAIVLAATPDAKDRSTQSVPRLSLAAVRLSEKPADLLVKPTLVWKLRTNKAGEHKTLMTYLCGFVKWHADYVVQITPGDGVTPDVLDFNGWVTLENTSGSAFPKAGLRLIAGDVRRLPDAWQRPLPREVADFIAGEAGDVRNRAGRLWKDEPAAREFKEQPLLDYHLYALNLPCTVGDHQIKQMSFLKKAGAKATRRYVFDPSQGISNLAIELVVQNKVDNSLGLPLPKGKVTLEQRGQDGEPIVLGRAEIDHIAVNEEVKLRYGLAFDVVGEQREFLVENLNKNSRVTYETRIRNHKSTTVIVRIYGVRLGREGILRQATRPHTVEHFQTYYFDFTLPANAEETLRYTVVYRSDWPPITYQRVDGGIGP
jgi:hypothetical protein